MTDRRDSHQRSALLTAIVAVGALALAVGAGFIAGSSVNKTTTVTRTEVRTVAPAVTSESEGAPRAGGRVACAPRAGVPGPRSDSSGHAAGPVRPGRPLAAIIRATAEVHHIALCLEKPALLTFSLECNSGECEEAAYGEFPAGPAEPHVFEPGRSLRCDIRSAGRYVVRVQANSAPIGYALNVQTRQPGALVERLKANVPPPSPEDACA